jgi:hypothetical protein
MRVLENRIARLESLRAGPDNNFLVVLISKFFSGGTPSARVGGNAGAILKQAPSETFEIFEARAIAAAKAAGDSFVAISVPNWDRTHGHAPAVRRLLRVFGIVDCPIVHEADSDGTPRHSTAHALA